MALDIKLVKQLRDITQAGFMDCKQALEATKGDLEKSIKFLREKGIAKAVKKAGAIAAEGVVLARANDKKAIICEINCQTDFSSNNKLFLDLANEIMEAIINSDATNLEQAKQIKLKSGVCIQQACEEFTGKIGEKIVLRRVNVLEKNGAQVIGAYQHVNRRYSSIVLFDKQPTNADLLKKIAMHIVAYNPKFVDHNDVDQQWLNNEKEIVLKQTIDSGKPKEFAQKIVDGRMKKRLSEVCLCCQPNDFIQGETIGQTLANNKCNVLKFFRYEIGEGIEKAKEDFASEVQKQLG